jgi:glucose/arabinose dehydrogenase
MRRLVLLVTVLGSVLAGLPHTQAAPLTVEAVPVIEDLIGVVAFTFLPDGRIIYGERFPGNIYFFDPSTGESTFFAKVNNIESGPERGLLGLAVHTRYPSKPYIYVYVTRTVPGGEIQNQILRITDSGGIGTNVKVIWRSDVPSYIAHNGGRILFGPDRALYVVVGDAVDPPNSQDLTNDAGKVHRMTDKGKAPPDNPFPDSTIWSYGHRNHFGFDFDPWTGNLWQMENGPECNDEINLITKGANYGWGPISDANGCTEPPPPPENTNQDGPDPVLPESWFTPTTAPVGAAFCRGCGLADSEGTMLAGFFNRATIERVVLSADRQDIVSITEIYQHTEFSVISLETAPDGTIYFNDFGAIYKLVEV